MARQHLGGCGTITPTTTTTTPLHMLVTMVSDPITLEIDTVAMDITIAPGMGVMVTEGITEVLLCLYNIIILKG